MGLLGWLSGNPDQETSSQSAKKRLQLTIFHDRMEMLELSPDKLASLKQELLEVIARYFEVNVGGTECTLEQDEREVAFVANIPVKRLKKEDY